MGLTQAQWYSKITTFIPGLLLNVSDGVQAAFLQALAKLVEAAQADAEYFVDQTFIDDAEDNFLDLHGAEREVVRSEGEIDHPNYGDRIRYITSSTAYSSLFSLVQAILNNGTPILFENCNAGVDDFYAGDEGAYLRSKRKIYNRFSVIIPGQEVLDDTDIKDSLVSTLSKSKAAGVFFDISYRGKLVGIELEDEDNLILQENGDTLFYD
jgi:hypothetical protein